MVVVECSHACVEVEHNRECCCDFVNRDGPGAVDAPIIHHVIDCVGAVAIVQFIVRIKDDELIHHENAHLEERGAD